MKRSGIQTLFSVKLNFDFKIRFKKYSYCKPNLIK